MNGDLEKTLDELCAGMKDGFVIGLGVMFLSLGVVEYVLGINSDPQFTDNGILITTIVLVAFEAVILLICSSISKRVI